jgi:arylsulfatase A-like enzyme
MGCRPVMESQRARVLPEVLRSSGYTTLGISTNVWIAEHSGFATGFDEFYLTCNQRTKALSDRGLRSRVTWDLEGVRARVDDGAIEAEKIVMDHVRAGAAQPFFWFVNLSECHSPYLPPRPYNDLPIRQRLRAAREARHHLTLEAIWQASLGGFDIADEAMARMRHLYRRSVRAMDDWLARLLDTLDAQGLLDDTVIIITSDHGENLGEGNLIGHAFSLDDRLIRIPLIASDPHVFPRSGVFSLVDLPRVVANAVDVEDHPWLEQEVPDDIALAQLDALLPPTDPRASKFIEDSGLGDEAFHRLTTSVSCATDGRFKLLREAEREVVFDLETDPLELSPLEGPQLEGAAPTLTSLRAAVAVAEKDGPGTDQLVTDSAVASGDENDDIADRMRTLGYL